MMVSIMVNLMIITGLMSHSYVSLALFIAAVGVGVAQITKHKLKSHKVTDAASPEASGAGGKVMTVAWFFVLLAWTGTLVYVIFTR